MFFNIQNSNFMAALKSERNGFAFMYPQCAEPDLNKTSNTLAETPTTFILMA